MNLTDLEYDVVGELSSDCQFIQLHHFKLIQNVLRPFRDQKLSIKLRIYKDTRSAAQNKYWWGIVVPTIQKWLKETKGERHTKDEVYAWIKIQLVGVKPEVKQILGQDVIVMKELSFSKMSTAEFSHTTNLVIDEMAKRDCHIPLPRGNNDLVDFVGEANPDEIVIRPSSSVTKKLPNKKTIELPKRKVIDEDSLDDL